MSNEIQQLQKEIAQLRDKVQKMETELKTVTQTLPIEIFPGQWMSVAQFNSMKQQLEDAVQTGQTIPVSRVVEYLEKKDTSDAMSLESLLVK